MIEDPIFADRMLSLGLARVSEAAAIASAKLIGSGDEKAADQAAVDAMRTQLNMLDIAGVVVIGEGERDEAPMLYIGEEVGSGNGPGVDIALDPLDQVARQGFGVVHDMIPVLVPVSRKASGRLRGPHRAYCRTIREKTRPQRNLLGTYGWAFMPDAVGA